MYGTLPKSTRTKTKFTKEDYAKLIVEKIVKEKSQETISTLLSCCQLYTTPLLIIRELRHLFNNHSNSNKSTVMAKCKTAQIVSTANYHTIRRPRKVPKEPKADDELEEILLQIKDLKLKLFDSQLEEPYSRDSGIASSVISDDELVLPEIPQLTSLDTRSRITEIVVDWIKREPMVFVDDIVFHVMRKFLDEIVAAKFLPQNQRATVESSMKTNTRVSTNFFCKITPLSEPITNLKNFDIQKTIGPLAAHINFMDGTFYKNLSRDVIISQLVQTGVRPRWNSYLNSMARLNSLISIAILKSSSPLDAAKMIDLFIILACCCRRAKNYNATVTITTALLSKPIQRLSKTWSKVTELKNFASLKLLANPSNNFRSLRKELTLASSKGEILAPYLTLVGKDVFWIAQGANDSQSIHEVESRTKMLASAIPRPARRIPEPCQICKGGQNSATEKCKVMEVLTTFTIFSDDVLYHLSYKMESPVNSFEKEEFKSLKPKKKSVRSLRKLIQLLV
ncbi:Oidioi.mRNA.OKI2018_I69.chr2.g4622.t1.cds [Oikopleura dioica]|uniref:Oidioi.mRNA.OKI2018_I69.chr2.g4622.t1.cds n=1 Tax=Oikopleura dioica TaxID=34765 RepID=A0ABN7T277_OIKDI|nr:Oidioi.mRNA.OKI2018_I69.chr2.g4622.t1.cds [Oikopleura dioica]